MKLVYMSLAKELHFAKDFIVKYIIKHNQAPLNPFNHGSYWLLDTVERDKIRDVCNYYVLRSDEIWVFNHNYKIEADGVIREIEIAKENNILIKYFIIDKDTQKIKEIKEMVYNEL